jgi:hypothetical protein
MRTHVSQVIHSSPESFDTLLEEAYLLTVTRIDKPLMFAHFSSHVKNKFPKSRVSSLLERVVNRLMFALTHSPLLLSFGERSRVLALVYLSLLLFKI